MNILVSTNNEHDEKLLIAFLNNHKYDYKSGVVEGGQELIDTFLEEYNREIDEAEAEIESGNYSTHEEVKKLFADRRKRN